MPRIPIEYLDCVIYLYPDIKAAEDGTNVGGSGFLVGVADSVETELTHIYAVTNNHVVSPPGAAQNTVLALNNKSNSGKGTIETHCGDWTSHPNGDDIAICLLPPRWREFDIRYVSLKNIFTQLEFQFGGEIGVGEIGIGDEVFMTGRFVGYDGKGRNKPKVRFGRISSLTPDPILQKELDRHQESIMIEMRSLPGFSGSPVFSYQPAIDLEQLQYGLNNLSNWALNGRLGVQHRFVMLTINTPKLVGINYGTATTSEQTHTTDSGFALAVPSWKLLEILHSASAVESRNKARLVYEAQKHQDNDE